MCHRLATQQYQFVVVARRHARKYMCVLHLMNFSDEFFSVNFFGEAQILKTFQIEYIHIIRWNWAQNPI